MVAIMPERALQPNVGNNLAGYRKLGRHLARQ
jgi:hypothetical protein